MAEFRTLRAGVFLPPFHPNDEDPLLCMERDFELMQWLDVHNYAEAWIGEHHSGGYEIYGQPELFIATAAERTRYIRLGTGVISLPYHHPFMVADRIVHHSLCRVMISPASRRVMMSMASAMRSRWVSGSMPSIMASDGNSPGPKPNIARPRVW